MAKENSYQEIGLVLRVAVAMCFIGHGCFGIITKSIWCNYFAVFGIGHDLAYQLMPVVGVMDVLLGLTMLFYPMRIIPAWLVAWGICTAFLRPLSGEPFAEFIERSGNFGAPLALLLLVGNGAGLRGWFTRIKPHPQPDPQQLKQLALWLKLATFLLLLGHGWLNLIHKKGLLDQYAGLGFPNPQAVAQFAGSMEILFAFIILVKPIRSLLLLFFIWKAGTEVFYPHYSLLEWIERGGSYGTLLALWILSGKAEVKDYVQRFFFLPAKLKAGR